MYANPVLGNAKSVACPRRPHVSGWPYNVHLTELVEGWPEFQNKRGGGGDFTLKTALNCCLLKWCLKYTIHAPFYIRRDNRTPGEPDLSILSSVMRRSVLGRKVTAAQRSCLTFPTSCGLAVRYGFTLHKTVVACWPAWQTLMSHSAWFLQETWRLVFM